MSSLRPFVAALSLMTLTTICSLLLFAATTAYSQTSTWRAADNPHVVQGTYTVAAGHTLIMEAGVQVQVDADSTFQINGELIGNGTAADPILINGGNNYSAEINVRGTMDLKFTNVKTNPALRAAGCLRGDQPCRRK